MGFLPGNYIQSNRPHDGKAYVWCGWCASAICASVVYLLVHLQNGNPPANRYDYHNLFPASIMKSVLPNSQGGEEGAGGLGGVCGEVGWRGGGAVANFVALHTFDVALVEVWAICK